MARAMCGEDGRATTDVVDATGVLLAMGVTGVDGNGVAGVRIAAADANAVVIGLPVGVVDAAVAVVVTVKEVAPPPVEPGNDMEEAGGTVSGRRVVVNRPEY